MYNFVSNFCHKFIFRLFFSFLFLLSSSMHYHSHSHCASSSWLLNILCLCYVLYAFVQSCFTIFIYFCHFLFAFFFFVFFKCTCKVFILFYTIFVACFSTSFSSYALLNQRFFILCFVNWNHFFVG